MYITHTEQNRGAQNIEEKKMRSEAVTQRERMNGW